MVYTIMQKNTVLCTIDYSNGLTNIFDQLPWDLYLEEGNDFDTRINNISNFDHWCASRVLSLDREHAKAILNSCALSQAVTDRDRAQVALKYRCLSLRDFYWIRMNTAETWEDFNLYENSLSKVTVDISLTGKTATLNNTYLIASDCSTLGVAPKAWVRDKSEIYLLKGNIGEDSVLREIEASSILKSLGFDVVTYEHCDWNGIPVSRCKCITDGNTCLVAAEEFACNHDIEPYLGRKYFMMNIADYLVGNTDRHWQNWYLEFDESGIKGLSALMDFNHAFEAEEDTRCLPEFSVFHRQKTQMEAAVDGMIRLGLQIPDIDLDGYKYGSYVRRRLELLQSRCLQG